MDEKKEVKEIQGTIIPIVENWGEKATEEEFFSALKIVAPGTNLRAGLDGVVRAGKGALIALENDKLLPLMDGGFRINCKFTAQKLVELSKMDGAIILSKDGKRISYANVLLTPSSKIKTSETGTRHKAGERTAKQIGGLVIAVSERKNEISVFYKNVKHPLKNTDEIRRKVNEHLQILEKQRELFDKHVDKLNKLELRNYLSLHQALLVIQKGRLIQKIAGDLKRYIIELGNEATLLKTRMKEITSGVDKETNLVIKDYTKLDSKRTKQLLENLSYDEILLPENILSTLAYDKEVQTDPIQGWRLLSKTSLTEAEIAAVIKEMGSLGKALYSNDRVYSVILGEEKAKLFREELEKIKLSP